MLRLNVEYLNFVSYGLYSDNRFNIIDIGIL